MIIGSRALHYHTGMPVRENADVDFIGYEPKGWIKEYYKGKRFEFHDPLKLNNQKAVELYCNNKGVCSLKGLALIKRSHLHRWGNFDKHITHYHKWIMPLIKGVTFTESDLDFLEERTKLTKKEFPRGNPKLTQSNEDFFDDNVDKVYDHDYIHELYAYESAPMYTRLKKEGKENLAWCEKDLWGELTFDQKLKCVAEETYVIATERFMVPKTWNYPTKLAYMIALKKVCTTLTSGWFRDFAIDHYPQILNLYDNEKFNKVKGELK